MQCVYDAVGMQSITGLPQYLSSDSFCQLPRCPAVHLKPHLCFAHKLGSRSEIGPQSVLAKAGLQKLARPRARGGGGPEEMTSKPVT